MSLINDALKQARAAQPAKTAVPAEGPALRPVEGARRSGGTDILLPALVVLILALAVMLLWIWFHGSGPAELAVRARTRPKTVQVNPVPAPEPVKQAAEASVPAPVRVKPAEPVTNVIVAATVPTIFNTNSSSVEVTNTVVPKPEPPAFKLQGIFFNPKHPSAMVSGKTVFVGDRVKGAKVISIEPETVTIVTQEGETKVMELN